VPLQLLHGNPGKRPLPRAQPRAETPRCPTSLSAAAKRVWKRLVPELDVLGLLTRVDRDALVAYCRTFARWQATEDFLDAHGEVYPIRDDQGRIKCMAQFPQVAIARNLLLVLKAYQQEFGLTPSARSRLDFPWPQTEYSGEVIRDKYGRPL
jgi:P27 family predicted phage terminase small subunit